MKKIALVLIAIAVLSAAAMAGDMAKSGQWGIQTSLGAASGSSSTIGLKFMASENFAVRVEAGFQSFSPGGGGSSTSGYGFGAGFEYHMTAVGGVSPYVGLGAGYAGFVQQKGAKVEITAEGPLGIYTANVLGRCELPMKAGNGSVQLHVTADRQLQGSFLWSLCFLHGCLVWRYH